MLYIVHTFWQTKIYQREKCKSRRTCGVHLPGIPKHCPLLYVKMSTTTDVVTNTESASLTVLRNSLQNKIKMTFLHVLQFDRVTTKMVLLNQLSMYCHNNCRQNYIRSGSGDAMNRQTPIPQQHDKFNENKRNI